MDRRAARPEDPAAAFAARAQPRGRAGAQAPGPSRHARRRDDGRRAGVLPRPARVLRGPPRPAGDGPHADGRPAAEGPAARGPLLRRDRRRGAGVHGRGGGRGVAPRHPAQDPPQRGGAAPVRGRADLHGGQPRRRPEPDADAGDAQAWRGAAGSCACSTRSPSPASTARASTTTGRWPTTSATTCSSPATTRTRTSSSCSSWRRWSRAVHKRARLLRCAVAHAGNDHRLGANEAPPGDHVGVPRRPARRRSSTRCSPARTAPHAEQEVIRLGLETLPGRAEGQHRPQPHLALRLHRQQVRVPRGRARASRSACRSPR